MTAAETRDLALTEPTNRLDCRAVIFESGGAEMSREEYASHHLGGDIQFSAAVDREALLRRDHVVGDLA